MTDEAADLTPRQAYVILCKMAIGKAQTLNDLVVWFKEQRAMNFPKYEIDQNRGEYKIIVAACAERKAQLLGTGAEDARAA